MPSLYARATRNPAPLLFFLMLGAATFAAADPLPLSWQDGAWLNAVRQHAAVVDPVRDRLLVSGGNGSENDFWSFDLNTLRWTRLGSFGYRKEHAAVYDPERDAMMFYGGWSSSNSVYYRDGWRVGLATNQWTQLGPAGWMPPGERTNFSLLLDSNHDRLLILGTGTIFSYDILANTWSSQACSGQYPTSDVGFGAVVDAARDRAISLTDYVREVNLSGAPVYSVLSPGGTPPPSLAGHAVLDSTRSRLLLFRDDMSVWALSLGASPQWTQAFSAGVSPSPRTGHAVALDAERDRALLCGGNITPAGPVENDVWSFDFATDSWNLVLNPGTISGRMDHCAVRASSLDAMLSFGGDAGVGNEVFAYPLVGGASGGNLTALGTPPSGRKSSAAAYDSQHDRLIVFGGRERSGSALRNDVWALTLGGSPTWTELSVPGGPVAREASLACYDPLRDRLLVFGGRSAASPMGMSDVWALSLSGTPLWEQISADGVMPRLYSGAIATYDSLRDRMVVVGLPESFTNTVAWALSLSGTPSWIDLAPGGDNPGALMFQAGTHDTHDDRILLFGGMTGAGNFVDPLTSLSLGVSPTFARLSLPGAPIPRAHAALVYDPIRFRSVLFGGKESWGPEMYGTYAAMSWLVADATTPALASLVSADVVDREARLTWLVGDAAYATWTVERSLQQGEWERVGSPAQEAGDYLSFRDAGLPAGAHVGYRLVALENGVERRMGEAWIAVPVAEAFALTRAAFANDRALRWAAVTPGPTEARLDVFDVGGRRLGGQRLAPTRTEQRGELRLAQPGRAGVYFVRLTQGTHTVTRRLALLD